MAIVINSFTPSTPLASAGQTETFTVSATENTTPTPIALSYQWQNSTNGGTTWNSISGATSTSYTTPTLNTGNNGTLYRVRVFTVTPAQEAYAPNSSGVTLTVVAANTITINGTLAPQYIANPGSNLTLTISAAYEPATVNANPTAVNDLSFQWQESTNGVTWTNISLGAQIVQSDTLAQSSPTDYFKKSELTYFNISSSQNLKRIRVLVSSTISSNSPVTSANSVLLVGNTITLSKQPGTGSDTTTVSKFKTTVAGSGQATLSVTASSTASSFTTLSYTWYYTTINLTTPTVVTANNVAGFSATGSNTNTITLTNIPFIKNLALYCVVSGTAGESSVTSNTASILITQTVEITTNPTAQTVAEDKYGPVANRSSFPEPVQDATFFVLMNQTEPNGTTNDATITWQRKDPGSSTWTDIQSTFANQSYYTTPPLRISTDSGAYYRAQLDGDQCTNEPFYAPSSTGVLLTVYRNIYFTGQPNSGSFVIGQPASFSVSVDVSSTATITYQWQVSTNYTSASPTWTNVANGSTYNGATTNVLSIGSVTSGLNGYAYRCIASAAGTLSSITSSVATLTTEADNFTSVSQINSVVVTQGSAASFSVTAQSVSLSTISYQWQKSTNYNPANPSAATWSNITGATSSTYSIASVASGDEAYYRARLTSFGGVSVVTNAAFLDVVLLSITVTANYPSTLTVLENDGGYSFSVSASTSVTAPIFYQWQYSTDNGLNFVDYPANAGFNSTSVTTNTFLLPDLDRNLNGIRIRCKCTSDATIPGSYFSSSCTISVDRRLYYTALPTIFTVPTGQPATLSASATSTGGVPTYQWQESTNGGGTWNNLTGEVNSTLVLNTPVDNRQYRARISLADVTSVQYFSASSGTVVTTVSPAGSTISTLATTIDIITAAYVGTYYSNEIMKTGASIGTVVCFPKPKTYTTTGATGDDYTNWYVTNSRGYSTKYVGYLPLTGSGTNWTAADYPELARLLQNKYGGTVSISTITNGFLPPFTIGAGGTKTGSVSGTFKMPVTLGKVLVGTGGVDNNRASPTVIAKYTATGGLGGSADEVGSIGGSYNYLQSEQLPPGSPGTTGATDGSAGTNVNTPSTFTLGSYTTTGWTDTQATVSVTYTENINWSVGPLAEYAFGTPTIHGHGFYGWGVDTSVQGASGGGNSSNNCRQVNYDFGAWLPGPAYVAEGSVFGTTVAANSNRAHIHGIALAGVDISAQGQGHGTGRGGVGSDSIAGGFDQLDTGSSLQDGLLTMSQQSNSLWNDVLSFYLRNNEALPLNYKYFRLKYFIKAW